MNINIFTLDPDVIQSFIHFCPENLKHTLRSNHSSFLWIGLTVNSMPSGLAIIELLAEPHMAKIVWFHIDPSHDVCVLGLQLLNKIEKQFHAQGYPKIAMQYTLPETASDSFEHILAQAKWGKSQILRYFFIVNASKLSTFQWAKKIQPPPNFHVFNWGQLRADQKDQIKSGCNTWYPAKESPFFNEEHMNLRFSHGLLFHNRLIGWLIAKQFEDHILLIEPFYIHKNFSHTNVGIYLIVNIIRLLANDPTIKKCVFIVDSVNEKMLHFSKRRFEPAIEETHLIKYSYKEL